MRKGKRAETYTRRKSDTCEEKVKREAEANKKKSEQEVCCLPSLSLLLAPPLFSFPPENAKILVLLEQSSSFFFFFCLHFILWGHTLCRCDPFICLVICFTFLRTLCLGHLYTFRNAIILLSSYRIQTKPDLFFFFLLFPPLGVLFVLPLCLGRQRKHKQSKEHTRANLDKNLYCQA